MNAWLFLVSCFGFLLAVPRMERFDFQDEENCLKPMLAEAAHLLWQAPALVLFYFLAFRFRLDLPAYFLFFSLFLAGYTLARLTKRNHIFFLASFMTAVTSLQASENPAYQLGAAFFAAFGILLFEWLLLGLQGMLLFSPIPPPLKGWPIRFFLAALLAMAFWRGFAL